MNHLPDDYNEKEMLENYLYERGKKHNYYKHYSSQKRICDILDDKAIYLTCGSNWNDKKDREHFNETDSAMLNFATCFSYSRDESVAMWMLYGGVKKTGAMIDFTNKAISSILCTQSVEIGAFIEGAFVSYSKLIRNQFEIDISDVVYYKEQKNGFYVKRSDDHGFIDNTDILNGIKAHTKTYPWNYENECRLRISVDKKEIKDIRDAYAIKLSLEGMDVGKTYERVYLQPGFVGVADKRFQKSVLDGEIEWDLCPDKCDGKR